MEFIKHHWLRLSHCKEVEQAGPYEKAFMEKLYRFCYATGLGGFDKGPLYKIYTWIIILGTLTIFILEQFYYIYLDLSLVDVISCFNTIILQASSTWKLLSVVYHKDKYEKISKSMEASNFDISNERRKKIFDYWVQKYDGYLSTLLNLRSCNLTVWTCMPFFSDVKYTLPVDIYVPFTITSDIQYFFIYVISATIFNYSSYWIIMTEGIIQVDLHLLICRYAVLADCFENIEEDVMLPEHEGLSYEQLMNNKEFKDRYLKRLGDLVEQHKVILRDTSALKTALSLPMLGQLAATCILLCMAAYQAIATLDDNKLKFVFSLFYLSYNMYSFFHVCKSCEELGEQSENIGQAAYFSGWEKGMSRLPTVKCAIMMIVARSNKPLIFLAGGMYPLTLNSYANLVNTSYSFLTMMLNTSKK